MKNKTRYFFVSYSFTGNRGTGVGCVTWVCKNSYINRDEFSKEIKEKDDSIEQMVITNIVELSKSDYEDFNK